MATKTISLELDAYEKLKLQKHPGESFSAVVRRADFEPKKGMTGREILEFHKKHGPFLSEEACDVIDELNRNDLPPDDPWDSSQIVA